MQLFDDSDDLASDTNENSDEISSRPHEKNEDEHESVFLSRSHSLGDLSMKSSVHLRKNNDKDRDVLTRRHALDPSGAHNLRNYVRHRKDSIVQRVIGYNYDDHSTAGGLYIRVGIGSKRKPCRSDLTFFAHLVFCLGTVIHSGLSILSNLENLSCVRWTAVMDDFSRLLFSFIQFFFIFKHSNVSIRSIIRSAIMSMSLSS